MTDTFRIENRPAIYTEDKDGDDLSSSLGAFDKMYYFDDNWTEENVLTLAKWLSFNCTKNFIFSKSETRIIAGGSTDHIQAWNNRDSYYNELVIAQYYIKLYKEDVIAFEMVWLTDFVYHA